jgi:hypothetical protein
MKVTNPGIYKWSKRIATKLAAKRERKYLEHLSPQRLFGFNAKCYVDDNDYREIESFSWMIDNDYF